MEYIDRLRKWATNHPDRIAVVDHDGNRKTTYKELLGYAMRVNHYLQNIGIGKEDTVGIYYAKGMEYIATRIGVMMAGAAWVALEDLMGKERIDYVIKDCDCKLVMSDKEWAEAMKLPESADFVEPDLHDLAFYIYTSGSSGTPKGAAQEYGVYERIYEGEAFLRDYVYPLGDETIEEPLIFAHVVPESYVAGIYITIGFLSLGSTIHVLSWETTKDPVRLCAYFNDHGIDSTFMTPTFLNVLQQLGIKSMRVGYTGGEIVSDIEPKDFDVVNIYGPSELGHPLGYYRLDRAYSNSPIGYPTKGSEIVLLDEDGNQGNEGELCVFLPFFRGYHNLSNENEKSFVTIGGKRFYRTSDYASVDKQGRYTIWGRIDEMVKINGNRVELTEVESAIKKAYNIDFCAVKAFKGNTGTPFLCAYYVDECNLSQENESHVLKSYLPFYMIPQHFIRLSEIPYNSNGKVDKLRLPEPVAFSESSTYVEPENDIQRIICEAFENVLECNRKIGINDDFFEIGGESITAMLVVVRCQIEGFCVQQIYEGRCAKAIEDLIKKASHENTSLSNEVKYVKVNASQNYLLRVQAQNRQASVLNLPIRFYLDPFVDLDRLAEAINKAILLHPSLCSTIEETKDGFIQRFDKNIQPDIMPERMSTEELDKLVKKFVHPFTFDNSPLFRCRLIETEESKEGLLDICHAICDGSSYHKFLEDIGDIYREEVVSRDDYLAICVEENNYRASESFRKNMDYFKERYHRDGCITLPIPDYNGQNNKDEEFILAFPFERAGVKKISDMYGLGRNGLYIAAVAIALAINRKNNNVAFKWTWNGRYDLRRINTVGCFIKDLPVTFYLEEELSVKDFLYMVADQIKDGIAHGNLSYWEEAGEYFGENLLCLIYQGDIYDYGDSDDIVKEITTLSSDNMACNNKMDLEILDSKEDYSVLVDYDAGIYKKSTVEAFAKLFCGVCNKLINLSDYTISVKNLLAEIEKE
ncbi:AMP-binding protein [Pseudobutyrivibrio sp. MD2005]|uniref:AMP-binding protein n=1 Tax=Pseudobutyrivibrio sp. MD2005 TaxID=1410616 RepID=UPI000688CD84|nr:AMP-binding protein [Pseudobutyrivibrio sp. MD2005]